MMGLGPRIERLFNRHRLVRRLALLWACWLITVTVMRVTAIEALPLVTAPVASVVAAVIGLLSVVIGLYQWSRHKDDCGRGE